MGDTDDEPPLRVFRGILARDHIDRPRRLALGVREEVAAETFQLEPVAASDAPCGFYQTQWPLIGTVFGFERRHCPGRFGLLVQVRCYGLGQRLDLLLAQLPPEREEVEHLVGYLRPP